MEHKVGDRVRIKQSGFRSFDGQLGCIHSKDINHHPQLFNISTEGMSDPINSCITLTSDHFINLEHLNESQKTQPLEYSSQVDELNKALQKGIVDSSPYKSGVPMLPKQVSFNFTLPIETHSAELDFNINNAAYIVKVEKVE